MGEIRLSAPQAYILTSLKRINLFLAGVGSGKTHLGGVVSGVLLTTAPKTFGFIGANTYNQLNTSTMLRIRETWKALFGWTEGRDYVVGKQPPKGFATEGHNFDRYDGILSHRSGGVVFLGSLDNARAHDGKEFAWALLDETKDSRENDVKEIILARLRQKGLYYGTNWQINDKEGTPFNPLYIFTSPAKVQWINDWFELDRFRPEIESRIYSEVDFFKKQFSDKCIAISSTYHNAANLPNDYIDTLINNLTEERANALVYGNPFTRTGGEFYSGFSAVRHVGRSSFNPELPIHITFDQNVVPYITAGIWQVDGAYLKKIDEFCLTNPNNTTGKLCDAIIARFGDQMKGLFYYGDASGHKRDTRGEATDYDIVRQKFRKWLNNHSDRTKRRNPPVIQRRDFINAILEGKTKYTVIIDERCKNSIKDLTYLKQDSNGQKHKETEKDELTGTTAQKYGHTSDADDYFLTTVLESDFARFTMS